MAIRKRLLAKKLLLCTAAPAASAVGGSFKGGQSMRDSVGSVTAAPRDFEGDLKPRPMAEAATVAPPP